MVPYLTERRKEQDKKIRKRGVSKRGILLAIILNITFTLVNSYLGISLGMGFSFSAVSILIAYTLLKDVDKQEITFIGIASQSYAVWWLMSMVIYLRMQKAIDLPTWLVPSVSVLKHGGIFTSAWILPFLTVTFLTMVGVLLSLIMGVVVADKVLEKKEMKFPMFQVTGTTINAIASENQRVEKSESSSRLLFRWLAIGSILVVLQLILAARGLPAQVIDFTDFFSQFGTAFGINLMLVFIGVGIIISPRVSLTVLGTGLVIYLGIIPLATYFGFLSIPPVAYEPITGQSQIMGFYQWILFHFLLSPALGVAILGLLLARVIGIFMMKKEEREETAEGKTTLGFFEFLKILFTRLRENTLAGLSFLALTVGSIAFVLVTGVFSVNIFISLGLAFFVILMGFLDSWIMLRMMGELGLSMGSHRLVFYETPLALCGVRNWAGYLAYPKVNPWSTGGIVGFTRVARMTNTKKKTIIEAYLLRLIPGITVGTLTVLFLWYTFRFPSNDIPGVPLYRNYSILKIFVSGNASGFVHPIQMVGAGIIAGVLGVLTPISVMGISFAMFLPISYVIPIGFGGVIRFILNKKKGKKWFEEKGRIIVSGFLAGATISQIVGSLLILFLF